MTFLLSQIRFKCRSPYFPYMWQNICKRKILRHYNIHRHIYEQ